MSAKNSDLEILIVETRGGDFEPISRWLESKQLHLVVATSFGMATAYCLENKNRLVSVLAASDHEDQTCIAFVQNLQERAHDLPVKFCTTTESKNLDYWKAVYLSDFASRSQQLIELHELYDAFADDVFPLLEKFDDLVVSYEQTVGDPEALPAIMRILHTIKGTAASVGFKNVAEFAHKFEDFVSTAQKNGAPLSPTDFTKIERGFDQLKKLLKTALVGVGGEEATEGTDIFSLQPVSLDDAAARLPQKTQSKSAPPTLSSHSGSGSEKIFVSLETLDEFINSTAKLVTIRSGFQQTISRLAMKYPNDVDIRALQLTTRQFDKEIIHLQSKAEELRKVPLTNVFKPLRKMIRETTKSLGKKIRVDIQGEDLRVDRLMAALISNCLIHMLRNCVDHGIEAPSERLALGKTEEGTISVSVSLTDDGVSVVIQDDGRGINPAVVRKKALQIGLFSAAQLDRMTENEVQRIIFAPGFSTAATVSDISGRGVGADMVKQTVEEAGGRLGLESTVGKGSRFYFSVPIPNASLVMQVILVRIGSQMLALRRDEVLTILSAEVARERGIIFDKSESRTLEFEGQFYNIYRPRMEAQASKAPSQKDGCLVILKRENERLCFEVDEVTGSEECVSLNLDKFTRSSAQNFEKATLLGNSKLALLGDFSSVMNLCLTPKALHKAA